MIPECSRTFPERFGAVKTSRSQKNCRNVGRPIFFRRKIKCWESSETHFPKISWRSKPISRGKRSFEVCAKAVIRTLWLESAGGFKYINCGPLLMGRHRMLMDVLLMLICVCIVKAAKFRLCLASGSTCSLNTISCPKQ